MADQPKENNEQTPAVETTAVETTSAQTTKVTTPAHVPAPPARVGQMSNPKRMSKGYRKHLRLQKRTGVAK